MTDAERIAKFAEWMGWTKKDTKKTWWWDDKDPVVPVNIWNPLERIQDAMMLEDEVERRGRNTQAEYIEALSNQLHYSSRMMERWLFAHATAAQRCAAVEKLMERKYVEIS